LRSTCSALKKVDHEDRAAGRFGDEPAVTVDLVRLVDIHLDGGDVAGAVEIGLRLGQRHEHEGGVVFRHADFEHGCNLIGLDARSRAHRRDRAARSNQRHAVADAQRQLIGQSPSNRHPLPCVEAFERALPDVVGDGWQLREIGGAHAAHQHTGCIERRGGQRLALDDRRGQDDPGHPGNALGDRLPVGQRLFQRLDQQMSVQAQNLVEQFLAEAVHHRHHDDQRGDAQHDAEEGKRGIDRDESLLPPRPQISQRQHPFERSERVGAACLAHRIVPRPPDFTRFWPFQALPCRPKQGRRPCSWRQSFDCIGRAHQLAAAVSPLLDLDLALGKPFRPDQDLPGNADEVGGSEFRSRALVEIVV